MTVRRIEEADFARLEQAGDNTKIFAENAKRSKFYVAEYCFVLEDENELVGAIRFFPDGEDALEVMALARPESITSASAFLAETIRQAVMPKIRTIGCNLYNSLADFAERIEIFRGAGFVVAQEKLSYTYEKESLPPYDNPLHFKSITEVGEAAFVDMVARVTVNTLDSVMAADAARLGDLPAAQAYVDSLKQIDFNPDWWKLGYDGEACIGLILPQKFHDGVGAINYIGVVPEYRGRGYGLSLLMEGTRILVDDGVYEIIADIDVANKPLAQQLEQVGYAFKEEEVVLALEIGR